MLNRRVFLRTAAATGGSALLTDNGFRSGSAHAADASSTRAVRVGGKEVRVVDVHAHCMIPDVAKVVERTPLARGNVPRSQIIGADRLAIMDKRGIDVAVLSLNQYWWYAADRDLAAKIVRAHDEGLRAICDQYPDRFVALTSVSLQHPDLAAQQLEYAVTKLGLRGASIGGHVNNVVPSGPEYDPFWKKAEELGVPVFMHPDGADNVLRDKALDGRGDLGNIIGNPLETTVFASRLIFDGTLDRAPRLKLCLAHGGGYLPSYLGRSEAACEYRNGADCANKRKPSEYLKDQIMVDSMVFSEEGIRHLVAECGAGQVVYGSDLPHNWPDTIDIIANAKSLSHADKAAILGGNLVKLLKIEAASPRKQG